MLLEVLNQMTTTLLYCGLFLFVISIPLYFGKLSDAIAGYNTMSKKDKEKYDELKLCRILAITLDVACIILILGGLKIISTTDVLLIVSIEMLIGVICANVLAKKK